MRPAVDVEPAAARAPSDPFHSATQAARALQAGEVTAQELVEHLIGRIARYNPGLNAIVTLDVERARERARQADEALSHGEWWGPLHGVPITIKDSFETAGLRTVSGYPPFHNRVPGQDAPAVARLRAAGAIILGKTNLPPLASGVQTNNPVFGRTNNPWNHARTPGGSSGGAAAAVAAGLSFLDLGSDIGGSIRIPAHFCGIYGLKATGGRISGKGHLASSRPLAVPPGWEALLQLASFGPLARSIDDLRLGLAIAAEPATPNLEPAPARLMSDLRVAWTDDFGGAPIAADTRQLMQRLAAAIGQAGAHVERQTAANLDYQEAWYVSGVCLGTINTLFQPPLARWGRRLVAPLLARTGPHDPLLQGLFAGSALRPQRVADALGRRERLIEWIERFLGSYDVWICPVFPSAAFAHCAPNAPIAVDDRQVSQLAANLLHSIIFNVSGHPVVTMPIGRSADGLPIGVQLVGRRWHELALLHAAEQIAACAGGYQRPPGYE
jgi:amidase